MWDLKSGKINLLGSSFGGQVLFQNASTAGTATINSNGSGTGVTFKDTSTAANATYSSVLGGLSFQDPSAACVLGAYPPL